MNTVIRFLTIDEIKLIYKNQIEHYGGYYGIRNENLLMSSIAMPSAGFGNEYFHKDIYHMGAAYCFHICMNHPFIDGNKRTGLASALVFLDLNGIRILDLDKVLYDTIIELCSGNISKEKLADIFESLSRN
ncbi:type II toxin-antitoxin system death-on-curing family toxin [Candidatus Dependentiae bacterium]|nr:type II toxin-antitoxin system death-on-curing family toxin [Candidatus Dependentiae bacterium]